MSKKTDKDEKKSQVEEVNTEAAEEVDSPWYYFYSQGCGWCKKTEPIVDELNKEGHDILKLDLADPDNRSLNQELQKEYNVKCGTPWFINESTGKGICGFREKDIIEKWLDGEDIPAPPRPKGPPPKLPLLEAPDEEVKKWSDDYEKWLKENDHLPDNQKKSAEEMLKMPRPKSDPPKPPAPQSDDAVLDKWAEDYDKWAVENDHLPNLQKGAQIVQRMKAQMNRQQPQGNSVSKLDPQQFAKINNMDAKIQSLEVKVNKIIEHFGIE